MRPLDPAQDALPKRDPRSDPGVRAALRAQFLERTHRGGWWYVLIAIILTLATRSAERAPLLPVAVLGFLLILAAWRARDVRAGRARSVAWIAVVQGLAMGVLIAWLITTDPRPHILALGLIFVCGVTSAGNGVMGLRFDSHALWLGAIGLPVMLALVSDHARDQWPLALAVVGFTIYLYRQGHHIRQDVARAHEDAVRLREAGAEKRAILSHLSHDVRTPLGAVLGYLQLSGDMRSLPEIQHCTATAESQLRVSLDLLNQLLDVAKMDFSHQAAEVTVFDPEPVVGSAMSVFEQAARDKGVAFERRVELPVPCRVSGSPTAVARCLSNLLSNAVRYTDSGSIRAEVGIEDRGAGRRALLIRVTDTGVGLGRDTLEQIRSCLDGDEALGVDSARGGDGLGLVGVARMMRSIGGSLDLAPTDGGGTCATASVPVRITAQPARLHGDLPCEGPAVRAV